jgi:HAD superfamily hydrolase (TIGR01509 family)
VEFDAILFDNDGVLVDTEALYFRANREALAGIGVTLDEAAYVELFLRTGRGAWHLAEAAGHDGAAIEALRAARDRAYAALVDGTELLMPGAAEVVAALAERYRLAIVTSSEPEPFARTHARTGLLPHFELVLTREHYRLSKPDPEPYLCAVERLGVPAGRCLVIEDSERGLQAAKAAGLRCWVIPSGFTKTGRFDAADAVLSDLGAAGRRLLATP